MDLSNFPETNICRVGKSEPPSLCVGASLLSNATSEGKFPSCCHAIACLQVDTHFVSLLEEREAYDQAKYLAALKRKDSPIAKLLAL